MSFFQELKRRNVVRVGIAYAVVSWLLLQLTEVLMSVIGLPDSAGKMIFLILVIGFIPVMLFAWAYELTPEGIKRDHEVDRSASIASHTGRKLDRLIIVVLALVVAWFLFDEFYLERQEIVEPPVAIVAEQDITPSIAVLPFVNMSGDAENEYFSDGLTETLLHMLAQLPDLRVAARTSSFSFKGKDSSIEEIATTLGVAHVLEGSVQKSGDRVRVTAQLIRADDGFHVWSQNYTRPLQDIFAIQDEIANDVVRALDESLLGGGQLGHVDTRDLDAYETYLKAMEQQARFSYGSLTAAESLFKQALLADSGFIDAQLGLVRNYLMMNSTGIIDNKEMIERITPILAQVRAEDPTNRVARGFELLALLQDRESAAGEKRDQALEEARLLLPLIPTETYLAGYVAAGTSFRQRKHEIAHGIVDASLMVDPLASFLHRIRGDIYKNQELYDEAIKSNMRSLDLSPGDANVMWRLSELAGVMNDVAGSFDWQRQAVEADPQDHELLAELAAQFYRLGLPEEGDRWLTRLRVIAPGEALTLKVEMDAAFSHGDTARGLEIAMRIIGEQMTMRQGVYPEAVWGYQMFMAEQERFEEAYRFLISVRPELENWQDAPGDFRGQLTQQAAASLFRMFAPPAQAQEAWTKVLANLDATGIPWREWDPILDLEDRFIRGNTEEAINLALEKVLTQPLDMDYLLNRYLATPLFRGLNDDPRIMAMMSDRDRELETTREQVRAMLQQPQWQE